MKVHVDCSNLGCAFGVETSYYAGTIKVGEQERVVDGVTDRDSYGIDDIILEMVLIEVGLIKGYDDIGALDAEVYDRLLDQCMDLNEESGDVSVPDEYLEGKSSGQG